MRDEAGDDEECGDSKRASSRSPRRRVEEGRRDDATTTKTTIASANADATALCTHTHTHTIIYPTCRRRRRLLDATLQVVTSPPPPGRQQTRVRWPTSPASGFARRTRRSGT